MKYSCNLIRDLLPLYCDGVCSEDSAEAVREHMSTCGECRNIYMGMQQPDAAGFSVGAEEYERRQAASMRAVKKKIKKKNRLFAAVGIVIGILLVRLFMAIGAVGLLVWDSANSKIEVHEDTGRYQDYIGVNAAKPYRGKWGLDESIFPADITGDMNVKEFKFVYYNPWDAQYLAYLTVEYTEEAFEEELARLEKKENDSPVGYYSVSGAPEGYDILAMDADPYYGFVYAVHPKEGGTAVTYIMTIFCNYALDLEIHEYVPSKYLLQGFDAGADNPYRAEMLK